MHGCAYGGLCSTVHCNSKNAHTNSHEQIEGKKTFVNVEKNINLTKTVTQY